MEIQKLGIIWFIILFHGMMWRAHADFNRPGFITIDCGNEAPGTPNHMSEADFTDTGISVQLPPDFRTDDPLYETVRSFPYGKRNCYTLTPTGGKDNRYLIRARFIYGNYDSKNSTPVFNLYVGVNLWTKVNLTSINQNLFQEIIYKPTTDFIPVCLVDIGQGTPFISSLELRPLNNDIYNLSSSMIMVRRYDTSEKTSTTLRTYKSYEDDDYDRLWAPYLNEQSQQYWTTEKANASLKDVKENNYRLPKPIFEAEAVPKYGEGLSIMFNYLLDSSDYYVYWHFVQTEVGYREFDINLKKNTIDLGTFTLPYLQEYTIFTLEPIKLNEGETTLDFDIAKTDASKLPPILNAIELFRDLKLSQLATHQDDVDAMMDLKKYYKSTAIKGWQGDPCLPIVPWDGVICSNTTSVPPRVTSLNLTSKGLAGDILSSLSNLTSLNYLNLSNNSLTGKIPEVLADMPSLKFLDLGGNKLSGSVPVKLLDRQQNGSLSLRLQHSMISFILRNLYYLYHSFNG